MRRARGGRFPCDIYIHSNSSSDDRAREARGDEGDGGVEGVDDDDGVDVSAVGRWGEDHEGEASDDDA